MKIIKIKWDFASTSWKMIYELTNKEVSIKSYFQYFTLNSM